MAQPVTGLDEHAQLKVIRLLLGAAFRLISGRYAHTGAMTLNGDTLPSELWNSALLALLVVPAPAIGPRLKLARELYLAADALINFPIPRTLTVVYLPAAASGGACERAVAVETRGQLRLAASAVAASAAAAGSPSALSLPAPAAVAALVRLPTQLVLRFLRRVTTGIAGRAAGVRARGGGAGGERRRRPAHAADHVRLGAADQCGGGGGAAVSV
jgi:hypothetical protein